VRVHGALHLRGKKMSIEVEKSLLESACKEMIATILLCLPNAFKGTIYRVGKPPDLISERITSGIVSADRRVISWGLPERSPYNPPGKPWIEYRDEPGKPLEAMAWCVERQKSWTSEDPRTDVRSVKLQVEGTVDDFHHMEPVLVRKADLHFDMYNGFDYPANVQGERIWQNTDYLVVAVIKIHFQPNTIRMGSHETVVIKKLSRSLGTELLSLQLREDSLKATQRLAKDRLNACNFLADSLRNAITKSGLVLSLLKHEIGYLRDQWEHLLLEGRKEQNGKAQAIKELNMRAEALGCAESSKQDLIAAHNRLLDLSLLPEKAEKWITLQVQERWKHLLEQFPQGEERTKEIWHAIENLKQSLYIGKDPETIRLYDKMPDHLKKEWIELVYKGDDRFDPVTLDSLVKILANPAIPIPSREKSRKALVQLKALAETMDQLERNTNFLLRQVLNGTDKNKSPSDGASKNIGLG
jgi:hypothetical protein